MNVTPLQLTAGAGSFEGSLDPNLGIVAVRLKCWAPDYSSAIYAPPPTLDMNLVENQPRTFSRDVSGDQGGYHVEVTLEGHKSPVDAVGEEFTLEGSTGEDPIETHPHYEALLTIYGGTEDSNGRAKWPKTIQDPNDPMIRSTVGRNPMHGVEGYYNPSLVWSRRWVSRVLRGSIIGSLGTIEAPPGNPPELSGNRNWLKMRARATWRGNIWQIEESWMLSGPYGFVPEMYRRF